MQRQAIPATIEQVKGNLFLFFRRILEMEKPLVLCTEVQKAYTEFAPCLEQPCAKMEVLIGSIQEVIVYAPQLYCALRVDIGKWLYVAFDLDSLQYTVVRKSVFLSFKEQLVGRAARGEWRLRLDVEPFNQDFPKVQDARDIGNGIEYLNRHLIDFFADRESELEHLLEFLTLHRYNGMPLMVSPRIKDVAALRQSVEQALEKLRQWEPQTLYDDIAHELQALGFERGWGRSVERIRTTMGLLQDILRKPDSPATIEHFLSQVPMIFRVLIVSPHGFFGQSKVLGYPDTGGQVVYILDQVRALEARMRANVHEQGIDIEPEIVVLTRLIPEAQGTTCDQREEQIWGTHNARILRVPFRDDHGEVIPHWISRFHIWPHLERFAFDAITEIRGAMGGRPDLIIGNYSDGNLVATLISQTLKVTQCTIAHALEKSKYLYSDLYWEDNEEDYHFSIQYTADLIGMNSADFIISSTYQEIAGSPTGIGQYESYKTFTLPGLYQVVNGIDVYDTKFNIISPGANEEVFFPYTRSERRLHALHPEIEALICGEPDSVSRGRLLDPAKPIIFSIARLDRVKNLTGLARWFAASDEMRQHANLVLIAGHVDKANSRDEEERAQIDIMHGIFDQYALDGSARWLGIQLEKQMTGELYRYIADGRGIFVQPALFEAFGLTVIEAMTTGLPVFATTFGGPLEIIRHGESGFHIDPTDDEASTAVIVDFLRESARNPASWDAISRSAIARVEEKYNWPHYVERLMTLAKVYGFWKHMTKKDREEIRRYIEMFYGLMYRPLVQRFMTGPGQQ
ncbi:Sucrose synthase [Desulfurispirillum indicum S5]|uniref:Sucrose synthase n=1 Tax=Desulfurispirillum indicum (strain ATCC BAA-1389 / DSM 22839 / S5) TaxID=653733 RepID=E6W4P1_DESIS|nr:sucrose synthase [Desulfurispirillum indicum]ADU67114.1 Sucrose synthase [Desulfurispirillum indicum S5]